MEKNTLIKFLKFGILLFLFLPLLFQIIKIKDFTPLNGVQEYKSKIYLDSVNKNLSWFNESFQEYYDLLSNENLILKSPLIRLRNQIQYTFFKKINAHDVYQYDDILFRFYTLKYNESFNFIGEKKAKDQILKLKKIQNYFGKDVPIITIIAPSKTYFFKEKLPLVNQLQSTKSNYKYIKKLILENQLHCIDFNSYFLKYKKSKIPIFGKGGIHWTSYASTVAMDSLVNYISYIKKKEFQQPIWELKNEFVFEYDDHDLAQLLNVFYPPNDKQVKALTFIKPLKYRNRIKALIISDSFFDVISKTELRNQIFTDDSDYLYYFTKNKNPQNGSQQINKNELISKINSVDCVILLNDIVNMEDFSWGFIDELYLQILKSK